MPADSTTDQFLNELVERRPIAPFQSRVGQVRKCPIVWKTLRIFCDSYTASTTFT
jgi:hypothetical protein